MVLYTTDCLRGAQEMDVHVYIADCLRGTQGMDVHVYSRLS